MTILTKLLVFAIGLVLGLLILKYQERIVYNLGKSEWAESKFGNGGTYTAWRFTAIAIIVLTFLAALFL